MKRVIVLMVGGAALLWAVVVRGNLDVLGTLTAKIVDFAASTATTPMQTGTTLPGTCSVGQAFFKTDATPGQNIYLCTAANTWTQVQGGGGGTFDWKPDGRYISLVTDFNQVEWNTGSPAYVGDFRFSRHQGSQNLNNPMGISPGITRAGFMVVSTTTTSGNISHWTTQLSGNDDDSTDSLYYQTDKPWRIEFTFAVPTASTLTDMDAVVGLMEPDVENPPALFGIGVRSSVGSDFYWVTASSNTWGSAVPTGVPADNGVWHRVVLRSDGATTYRFYASLDGGAEVSICASGCDITMGSWQSYTWANRVGVFLRTNAAEQKRIAVEYLSFWMDRGTTR